MTHSVESPFAAAADATPRDGLTVLEGFGADGRVTEATLFAADRCGSSDLHDDLLAYLMQRPTTP